MAPSIRKEQKLCFELFQMKERNRQTVTRKEIAEYTGWKEKGTVHTYLAKGYLEDFVTVVDRKKHEYRVHDTLSINELEFASRISQKHSQQDKGDTQNLNSSKLSYRLMEKSVQAALSAIEIYNKPDFKYREQTFSILMVNAWEMLLKAKCISNANEDLTCIQVKSNNSGSNLSRCGNVRTIDLFKAARKLSIENELYAGLEVLVEIRDSAIHFINDDKQLNRKIVEVGTASLRSFIEAIKDWFGKDLSQYNFYLMPLSFFHLHEMDSFSINFESIQHQNLINFISEKELEFPSNPEKKHNISLLVEAKWAKSNTLKAMPYKHDPNNPNAVPIKVNSEDEFRKKYNWNWSGDLKPKLKSRYTDLKFDKKFWAIKKELEKNDQYCMERYLDWNNPKSTKKRFYNSNILKGFDLHYTKK